MTFTEAVRAMAERSGYFIGRPGGIVLIHTNTGALIRPDRKAKSWLNLRVLDVLAVDWGLFPLQEVEQPDVNQQA
jgi:hypothetical protein